jgi:phospho-N-acetylmuramoyl-pentapeptide-transferase
MGGLFVLGAGMLVAALANGCSVEGALVAGAIVGFGLLGFIDDYLKVHRRKATGLRMMTKLLVTLGIGAGVGWAVVVSQGAQVTTLTIPWIRGTVDLGWGWVPFATLVVAGSSHAVNLTDGMDGLAAGCVAIVLSALGIWALLGDPRHRVLIPWCAALSGACVGFLWFNTFPASVYLGDVGALGLGAAVGTIGLLTRTELMLVILGAVFVMEALSVILQVASYRWRGRQRIFRVAPIHHHFHLGGLPEPKVTVRFWIVGLLVAMLGLSAIR